MHLGAGHSWRVALCPLDHPGMDRKELKLSTFRQKEKGKKTQDYSDYQQTMLKQECCLIREATVPHSWLLVEDSG